MRRLYIDQGGTQINRTLDQNGIGFTKHPRLGRDTSQDGYRLAAKVLWENRHALEKALKARNVFSEVLLPIITLHGVKCHLDGDLMVLNAYWGFDELYVVTTSDRIAAKQELFVDLPKVMVITV